MEKFKKMAAWQRSGFASLLLFAMVTVVSVFTSCEGLVNVEKDLVYTYKVVNIDGTSTSSEKFCRDDLSANGIPSEKTSSQGFVVKVKGNSDKAVLDDGDNRVIAEFKGYMEKIDKSKLKYTPYKVQITRDEYVEKSEYSSEAVAKVIYFYDIVKP